MRKGGIRRNKGKKWEGEEEKEEKKWGEKEEIKNNCHFK
jgi:hypothetical protein